MEPGDGDESPPERKPNGQWAKGTSGNPNGRPRKMPDPDMADAFLFGQVGVNITVAGERQFVTRRELNLLKLYETAAKGRISAQIYLDKKFDKAHAVRAELRMLLANFALYYSEHQEEDIPAESLFLMQEAIKTLTEPWPGIKGGTTTPD